MYQIGMKDLISLHSCISSGSDISAESDHYVSLALNMLRQSGIKLNSTRRSGNVSAVKVEAGLVLMKDITNADIPVLPKFIRAVDLWGHFGTK